MCMYVCMCVYVYVCLCLAIFVIRYLRLVDTCVSGEAVNAVLEAKRSSVALWLFVDNPPRGAAGDRHVDRRRRRLPRLSDSLRRLQCRRQHPSFRSSSVARPLVQFLAPC